MLKLRPCPFCGEADDLEACQPQSTYYAVLCGNCHAEGPPAWDGANPTPDQAGELWGYVQAEPPVQH